MRSLAKRMITPLRRMAKRHPALRRLMREIMYCVRRLRYMLCGISTKIDDKTIIFEVFSGRSYSDSPKAVYEYMLGETRFADYKYIWVFREPEKYRALEKNANTEIVRYRSMDYDRALHRAKYWVFNYRALDQYVPSKGQIYVQCWHGTPLKRLGYDIEHSDNAMNSREEIRDKYRRDAARFKYLLSPCAFATERFRTAWNLEAAGKEKALIETGYPRNDFLVNYTTADVQRIKRNLSLDGEHVGDKKILLYAPTWRDNQHSSGLGYTYEEAVSFDKLREALGDEYLILFRAHYLVASSFDFSRYEGFVYDVSEYDDINELYVISDMLITDYSSVFFDYAILNRPILFYMYDLEQYRDEIRGFYLGLDELPGPIVRTEEELAETIRQELKGAGETAHRERHQVFNDRFNYLNDGRASERLVEEVVRV